MISYAFAQNAPAADPTGGLMQLLPLILMFVVIWFLMIRPQMKRAKEHKQMLEALKVGDEVITQGGVIGVVRALDENFVTVEVAKGVEVVVQKPYIMAVLVKGTVKHLS